MIVVPHVTSSFIITCILYIAMYSLQLKYHLYYIQSHETQQ